MDKKPIPYIPIDSLKTQRVEVYINDLQKRLEQIRDKHDTIFVECCDILKKIQEVSTHTFTKQQEIGQIISEFEELGLKTNTNDSVLKKALIQRVGDVKRLREKFEKIFQDNINEFIVRPKDSMENYDKVHAECSGKSLRQRVFNEEEQDSEMWSTIESFYSLPTDVNEDTPESLCFEENEIGKIVD